MLIWVIWLSAGRMDHSNYKNEVNQRSVTVRERYGVETLSSLT